VITGRLRTGPLSEPVDLAAGDFFRFPGDVAHRYVCLTDRATAHMVTTLPQIRQIGPVIPPPTASVTTNDPARGPVFESASCAKRWTL